MVLPLTSTLEGGESALLLPSKMRTLRNSVAFPVGRRLLRLAQGTDPQNRHECGKFHTPPGPEFED